MIFFFSYTLLFPPFQGVGDVKEVPLHQEGTSRLAECSGLEGLQGNITAENGQQVILPNTIVI